MSNNIKINEHELMMMLVPAFRYAIKRNNHLEPYHTINNIKGYLKLLTTKKLKTYWNNKFLEELNLHKEYYDKLEEPNKIIVDKFKEFLENNLK